MTRRRVVLLVLIAGVLLGILLGSRLALRAAVDAGLSDLRKHEQLQADIADVHWTLRGVGADEIRIKDSDGAPLLSVAGASVRPRWRWPVHGPGLWMGVQEVELVDPVRYLKTLPSDRTSLYDTVVEGTETMHRNFGSAPLVFEIENASVPTRCGQLRVRWLRFDLRALSTTKLHGAVTGAVSLKQGATTTEGRIDGAATLRLFADSLQAEGSLDATDVESVPSNGPVAEETMRLVFGIRQPAPGWDVVLEPHRWVRVEGEHAAAALRECLGSTDP